MTGPYEGRLTKLRLGVYAAAALILAAVLLLALVTPPWVPSQADEIPIAQLLTGTTVRVGAGNLEKTAVAVSRAVYPGPGSPGAVVLFPDDDWRAGLAAAALTAPPVDAVLLPVSPHGLSDAVSEELERLKPSGIPWDGGIQVLALGGVTDSVISQVEDRGYSVRRMTETDPAVLAREVDDYLAAITGHHNDHVLVVPVDAPEFALLAASWAAATGHTVAFSDRSTLPTATREILDLRPTSAFIYVFAPRDIIGSEVLGQLVFFGHVQRIPGDDPYAASAAFAGYSDRGAEFRWWLGLTPRIFGWGISGPGHGFVFADPDEPMHAVVAAALSRRGAHGPLLWVNGDALSEPTAAFLSRVRPPGAIPQQPLVNRGWIIGDDSHISLTAQESICRLLNAPGRREEARADEQTAGAVRP